MHQNRIDTKVGSLVRASSLVMSGGEALVPMALHPAGEALSPAFSSHDSLVFVHVPKTGGSSFEERLLLHETADGCGCSCKSQWSPAKHNGHAIDPVETCCCPRCSLTQHSRPFQSHALVDNWLWQPSTVGWLGISPHRPLSVMQQDIHARLNATARRGRVIFAILLRAPRQRFLSEFYETLNGWGDEASTLRREHLAMYERGTMHAAGPPWPSCADEIERMLAAEAGSAPEESAGSARRASGAQASAVASAPRRRTADGTDRFNVDVMGAAEYNALFAPWLRCTRNMAADRLTRTLAYGQDELAAHLCGPPPEDHVHEAPPRLSVAECELRVAAHVLTHTLSYVGLSEERRSSERLLRAHLGLALQPTARDEPDHGAGLHAANESVYLTFDALEPELQARVDALNSNDIKLYDLAQRLFAERLQAFGLAPAP